MRSLPRFLRRLALCGLLLQGAASFAGEAPLSVEGKTIPDLPVDKALVLDLEMGHSIIWKVNGKAVPVEKIGPLIETSKAPLVVAIIGKTMDDKDVPGFARIALAAGKKFYARQMRGNIDSINYYSEYTLPQDGKNSASGVNIK